MTKATSKPLVNRKRGLDLLRQVYDELYTHLSDEFSPAELLQAAQTLIDASREEYGAKTYQDIQLHPGYFSFDVDMMLERQQWIILNNESTISRCFEHDMIPSLEAIEYLKRIYNPDPYFHRG